MEDVIYIVLFVIYVIFALLKKGAEKNEGEKPAKRKILTPQEVLERIEEIKREQEAKALAREGQQEQELPPPPAAEAQSSASDEERPSNIPHPVEYNDPVPKTETKYDSPFSYDNMTSLEYYERESPKAIIKETSPDITTAPSEGRNISSFYSANMNLRTIFIWKEILDTPVALRGRNTMLRRF